MIRFLILDLNRYTKSLVLTGLFAISGVFSQMDAGAIQNDRLKEWMTPLWKGEIVHNEPLLMWAPEGQLPEAPLLFEAEEILSVRDSALQITYQPKTDWTYENGKLHLPAGSRIPWMTASQLYPTEKGDAQTTMPRIGGGYLLFREGSYFHRQQLAVTYRHKDEAWTGPVPTFQANLLPRSVAKLKQKEKVKILAYGDSITAGANASSRYQIPPLQPTWAALVGLWLHQVYGADVTVANKAVGGKTSAWGAENAAAACDAEHPDLVIIGFGMNELTVPVEKFQTNLRAIMHAARQANPDVEFILIGSMLPNTEWKSLGNLPAFAQSLRELSGLGVAFVDMGAMHETLLKRKRYVDMTGNHVNHPNDFLIRLYAQCVVSQLIDSF